MRFWVERFWKLFKIWFKDRRSDKRNIFFKLDNYKIICNFKKYSEYYYKPSIY